MGFILDTQSFHLYITSIAYSTTKNRLYFAYTAGSVEIYSIDISGSTLSTTANMTYQIDSRVQSLLMVGSMLYIGANLPGSNGLYSVDIDSSNKPVKMIDISNNVFSINALAVGPPNNTKLYSIQSYEGDSNNILYESSRNTFNQSTIQRLIQILCI
jgi:hypothetical protein